MPHRLLYLPIVIAALCLCLALPGCSPPQVLNDDECLAAVDALWTAVTARRTDLLDQAEAELGRLYEAGSIPADGDAELGKIIDQARSGEWEAAARRLRKFIQGQRRASET